MGLQIEDSPGEPGGERLNSDEMQALEVDAAAAQGFDEERSPLIPDLSYRSASGFVVMFDVTRQVSLERALFLVRQVRVRDKQLQKRAGADSSVFTPVILVGNKADLVPGGAESSLLEENRKRLREQSRAMQFPVFIGSAKKNEFSLDMGLTSSKLKADGISLPNPSRAEDLLMCITQLISHSPFSSYRRMMSLDRDDDEEKEKTAKKEEESFASLCCCCCSRRS